MAGQDVEGLITQAQEALKNGDVQRARSLVKEILATDQRNSRGWLLATYLTNEAAQQRKFLDNAKKIAPDDPEVLRRERELFPRKAHGVFTPDPIQPQPVPGATAPRPAAPDTDHIPTLSDGVVLRVVSRSIAFRPWAIAAGSVVAVVLVLLLLNVLFQNQTQNAPSAVVLRLYPTLQTGDNAALANLFTDEVRTLCANDFVRCLQVPVNDFQSYSISGENLSTSAAIERLTIHYKGNAGDRCQDFLVLNTNQGWRIQKDMGGGIVPCTTQMATLPGQSGNTVATSIVIQPSKAFTATFDATQLGVVQTTTALAQTQNAMFIAPTLTATFLAPGFTQTALVSKQNSLNTAIAATATQSVVLITQTAQWVGLATGTPVAQTQIAASLTQAAADFKATLKGTLVAAKNILGHSGTSIVVLNADGSNLKSLNAIGIDPIWSPDGKLIAYTNREHQSSIHMMLADGSNNKELPINDAPFGTGWATWSSDGTKLILEGGIRLTGRGLFVASLDGKSVVRLISTDDDYPGGWTTSSPDGKQILYTKDDQLWVVPATGGISRSLIKQPGARAALWSSDGKQIVFDAGDDRERGIYMMNADGSNLRRITPKNVYVALPTWSPDNTKIAALCYGVQGNHLCVMNADGTSLIHITADGGFDGRISWTK